jgi:hypothetical protein
VRHATDGMLRRLGDEPSAVPDAVRSHLAGCSRCDSRQLLISQDAAQCAWLLSGPRLVPDVESGWRRLERELPEPAASRSGWRALMPAIPHRPYRFPRVSLRTGIVIGVAGIVAAGTAAAATLTTVFAPVRVVPVQLSNSDLQAVAAFMGVGGSHVLGGFPGPSGSRTLPFGTVTWSSSGNAEQVRSLAQASAAAGFQVRLPTRLPSGVGSAESFAVQPQVKATVSFSAAEPGVGGSSVELDAGPAVLAEYGSASGAGLPTLAVLTMPRPVATSTGSTTRQIEAFLLSQPGIPPQLAEEIRLLGSSGTTLPVPVPPGASARSVQVAGWPGVLVADASNSAAGVIWEDGRGTLHIVAGILDSQDVLYVAKQLG